MIFMHVIKDIRLLIKRIIFDKFLDGVLHGGY